MGSGNVVSAFVRNCDLFLFLNNRLLASSQMILTEISRDSAISQHFGNDTHSLIAVERWSSFIKC